MDPAKRMATELNEANKDFQAYRAAGGERDATWWLHHNRPALFNRMVNARTAHLDSYGTERNWRPIPRGHR